MLVPPRSRSPTICSHPLTVTADFCAGQNYTTQVVSQDGRETDAPPQAKGVKKGESRSRELSATRPGHIARSVELSFRCVS